MCFGGGGGSPAPQNAPPPIVARNPDLTRASRLAPKKKLVDEDNVTGVEYGSSAKEGGAAAGKKVNTDSLRIKLNTGTDATTAGQGGINV
tara:strand:- start:404 stop:673 length:270 start_codon:yes stop_codon:yes gene_type:complete